jgi:hypothetical protein
MRIRHKEIRQRRQRRLKRLKLRTKAQREKHTKSRPVATAAPTPAES